MMKARQCVPSSDSRQGQEYLERYRIDSRPELGGLPRELREIILCIHGSLFEPGFNVKVVKQRCRIRNHNVSSRFRYAIGKGIKEYIENHRMQAAVQLLRSQKVAVFEIAMMTGYNHVETFYQVFHRHYGCTPARYRSQMDE